MDGYPSLMSPWEQRARWPNTMTWRWGCFSSGKKSFPLGTLRAACWIICIQEDQEFPELGAGGSPASASTAGWSCLGVCFYVIMFCFQIQQSPRDFASLKKQNKTLKTLKSGKVAHTCSLGISEAEAGRLLWVWDRFAVQGEILCPQSEAQQNAQLLPPQEIVSFDSYRGLGSLFLTINWSSRAG